MFIAHNSVLTSWGSTGYIHRNKSRAEQSWLCCLCWALDWLSVHSVGFGWVGGIGVSHPNPTEWTESQASWACGSIARTKLLCKLKAIVYKRNFNCNSFTYYFNYIILNGLLDYCTSICEHNPSILTWQAQKRCSYPDTITHDSASIKTFWV